MSKLSVNNLKASEENTKTQKKIQIKINININININKRFMRKS